MDTVCEVCGDIGFERVLLCCRDCRCSSAHLYCLEAVVFDASLADWVCYECLQKRREVSCSTSLEIVLCERPPNHGYSDSATVHQPVTQRVELPSGIGIWRNRTSHMLKYKSLKKRFKRKPNFWPMASCTYKRRLTIATCTDHAKSGEAIWAAKGDNGGNQHVENVTVPSNVDHLGPCTLNMAVMSLEESGEDILCENGSMDEALPHGDYVLSRTSFLSEALPHGDYVLSCTSFLSEAQKERVMAFIQETKPAITVFVSVLGKSNVKPPGPFLGISKEYAFAYFPHESTKVTLQRPGISKTWHPLFYKRNQSGNNFLVGRWLDFVRNNCVEEGDMCLLEPTKDEGRPTYTVHLLRASATPATSGDGFQRVAPHPGESTAKIDSEVHNMEEPSNEKHVCSERVMHQVSEESLESEDSDDPTTPPYILPCRHDLSKSQKKIVEERVRTIRSGVPLYVTVMKNNNAGDAQRWMLELGVRFAGVYLPSSGRTVVLQRMGKTWDTQMVIHNGRRWFLDGGWTKFARDNGLRVGDFCLFELKKNERNITMSVHIIYKEQF